MTKDLSFEKFSEILISTGDLDPDYIFIKNVSRNMNLSNEEIAHWIVQKSVIYNSASELAHMFEKVPYKELSFGNERRKAKPYAQIFYNDFYHRAHLHGDGFFDFFSVHTPRDGNHAMQFLQQIKGIGPWAAWKVLDLLERVLNIPIDFSKIDFRNAYEFPLKGLLMLNGFDESQWNKLKHWSDVDYHAILMDAQLQLGPVLRMQAPPGRDRKVNIQEIETLFCKYHSYVHGHYKPEQDLLGLRKRIEESEFESVRKLREFCP